MKFNFCLTIILLLLCISGLPISCNNANHTLQIKAAIIYKSDGVKPVARTKFYLLKSDITKEKNKKTDFIIQDGFFYTPETLRSFALFDTLQKTDTSHVRVGIQEWVINDYIVTTTETDFEGNAKFENLAPETYWIVGYTDTRSKDGFVVWNLKVDMSKQKGNEPILLDQNNAHKVSKSS